MDEVPVFEAMCEGEFDDKPRFYREAFDAGYGHTPGSCDDHFDPGSWASFQDGNGIPSAFNRTDLRGKEREAFQATRNEYQQTLITQRHKLVVYRDFEDGELYNLETDPDQYRYLWHDPRSRGLRETLLHQFVRTNMRREGASEPRKSFA